MHIPLLMASPEKPIRWEPPVNRHYDCVGPADPVSKIRPIKFARPFHESRLEKEFRLKQEAVQKWNHDFWKRHNETFEREKQEYIREVMEKTDVAKPTDVESEMLSEFYANFLKKRRELHWNYNMAWYKKEPFLALSGYKSGFVSLVKKTAEKIV